MTGRLTTRAADGRSFEAFVLDTYATLLVDDERLERAAASLGRLTGRQAEVRDVLRVHKAVPPFQHAMARLASVGTGQQRRDARRIVAWHADDEVRLATHLRLLRDELAWIAERPEVAGTGLAVIKGFNNVRFYADPAPRWSRDIDLYVPDWASSLALVRLLRERGYAFDEGECPWFKGEPERGRAEYGQVFLVRGEGERFSRVDIHFGTYSVGAASYLDFPLAEYYEPVGERVAHQGINPTGTLLLMFAHALSDGYVSVKDVNDAVSIALTRTDVDFGRVGREVRRHCLEPQALLLADHLTAVFRHERVIELAAALRSCAGDGRRSAMWRMHDRNWHRRAAVNAGHAFRSALRTRRGPVAAVRRAVQCAVFYNRRLSVRVAERSVVQRLLVRLMARTDLTGWRLRSDACPTMIHTAHPVLAPASGMPGDSGRAWTGLKPTTAVGVRVGGAYPDRQVVVIGDDVFLCSWDQIVTRGQAAFAHSVARAHRKERADG